MTTRQELYDRIRAASGDEVVLEEMIRLGFWPRGGELPDDPADEIRRRGELERQLCALTTENKRLQNAEAIKRDLRKQRLEESRRKRQQHKEKRIRERQERAAAWRRRKRNEILYLGKGVSDGLGGHQADETKLTDLQMPVLRTASDLAQALGISVGSLRFLAFARTTSTVSHYKRFAIRKKTGGLRHISAPMPRLKRAQEWILVRILERVPLHIAAHGFRRGRSIVSNAQPHVGSDVVINADIEDFFPTVTFRRIKGVFRSLGYAEEIATILALLCSEPEIATIDLDGQTYYVARGERFLPQGAPSSPAITNIICRGLDARLHHAAEQLGFRYTRYADDMTFSGSAQAARHIGTTLRRIRYVVEDEGFRLHPRKTRVLRSGSRQEVTGLTVNERVNVPRRVMRKFRATLFQIERDGPAGKTWGSGNDVMTSIEGFANFVQMVDPVRGAELRRRVEALIERYGRLAPPRPQRPRWQPRPEPPEEDAATASAKPSGQTRAQRQARRKKPWWMFWKFW